MSFVLLSIFIVARLVMSLFNLGLWVSEFLGGCFGRLGVWVLVCGLGVCGLCACVSMGSSKFVYAYLGVC